MKTTLDLIVARRVCDALHEDRALRVDATGIRVSAEEGTVTLEGIMSCLAAVERAREAIRAVDGVVHIEDRLRIRGP